MASIVGRDLAISTKVAVDVAAFIKGKQIDSAILYLEQVVAKEKAMPFRKHVKSIPHRKGMRTGRFPKIVSQQVIDLLKGLKSNAQDKGLDTSKLIIVHAAAQKASVAFHYGRRRTHRKNTHFEIVAQQIEPKQKKVKKVQSETKPEEKKTQSEAKASAAHTSKGGPE